MDFDYNAEDIDAEEDEGEREYAPSRDNVVFLIDVQASMFQPAGLTEAEGFQESDRWFDVALRVAREFTKMHIISSDSDCIAVVFYGTSATKNANNFENVYVLVELEEPSARSIRDLDNMMGGDFTDKIGTAEAPAPDHLRNGLWAASQLLAGSKNAYKRVLVFSTDANPAGSGPRAETYKRNIDERAKALHEANVAVEVFPLAPPNKAFPMDFWNGVIHAAEDGEGGAAFSEGSDTVYRMRKLPGLLRQKAYRKRTAGRVRWQFPGGFRLAVALYALIQPAHKSGPTFLNARTNQPLQVESAMICNDTGAVLTEVPTRCFPKLGRDAERLKDRFPQIFMTPSELKDIKAILEPGLHLIGFKDMACLKPWHTWRQSTFVYPDERAMPGSTTAFIALHQAMADAGKYALCAFARNRSAEARQVALVPAQEELDAYGEQVAPPGMHMLHLCFADDIREPERDPAFVGDPPYPVASEEQIGAAEALIDALKMSPEESYVGIFSNPMLQRHYQVLEALALGEPPPEEVALLQPNIEGMRAEAGAEVERFKVLCYGEGYDEPGFGAKKGAATGKKRERDPEKDAAALAAIADVDYAGLASKGQLGKLKVDTLKEYCRAHGLKLAGKKDELIERISEHVSKGSA